MSAPVFALLTGGGTGGHTYPAIAVAPGAPAARRTRCGSSAASGGSRAGSFPRPGSRSTCCPAAGCSAGSRCRTSPRSGRVLGRRARGRDRAPHRPRVVVGFGGYASFPCVLAARLLRVPVVVHEQDAAPGLANRLGVRLGARPAVSLARTRRCRTPRSRATRSAPEFAAPRTAPRPRGHPALVAVFGGAQGARTINRAALGCYDRWRARTDLAVHHVCGPRNLDACTAELAAARRERRRARVRARRLRGAHGSRLRPRAALAVCRSGAGTIAELTAAGLPAVLVPLPGAPSDHQTRNAQTLERAGAAVMLRDDECDPARLDHVVSELLARARSARRHGRRGPRRSGGATRPSAWPISSRSTPVPPDADRARAARPVAHRGGCTSSVSAGAGMSAIALVLARMGHTVSGSDIKSTAVLERLAAAGVDVHVGNRAEHVPGRRRRRRVLDRDPAAKRRAGRRAAQLGIPVLHRSAALAALAATRRTIAVAGSHGKTTSASMLALILRRAGWSPSFVIGGEVNEVGSNAAFGDGRVARRRGRRERRHVPAPRAAGRARHQRRTRPSRLLRRLRRARRRVRAVRRRGRRPGRVLRRRRGRGAAGRGTAPRSAPTASRPTPTTASSTRSSTGAAAGSRWSSTARAHRDRGARRA